MAFHQHPHHLIAWAPGATVIMRTETHNWLIPPTHGLWVPAATAHAVDVVHSGHTYSIAVDARRSSRWTEPTGLLITPLVRELIAYLDTHTDSDATRTRIETVLLDVLEAAPSCCLPVPLPTDPRIRAIADALLTNPADQRDLAAWGHEVSAGVRTLTRLFSNETGMTFARWRTHVRVGAALPHLARGASIGATARAVGYRKPGAFSDAFQRVTGQAPSRYSAQS